MCIIGLLAKFQMDTRQFSLRGCDQSLFSTMALDRQWMKNL
jgi:hypothetical protein